MIYVHNILLTCLRTFVRSIFLCFVTWHGHSPWHLHDKSPQNTHYSDVCNTFSHRIKKYFRLLTICHPPPASVHMWQILHFLKRKKSTCLLSVYFWQNVFMDVYMSGATVWGLGQVVSIMPLLTGPCHPRATVLSSQPGLDTSPGNQSTGPRDTITWSWGWLSLN